MRAPRSLAVFALYRLTHGPERPQALIEALRSATTRSAAEAGWHASRIWRDTDESGDLLLVEEWEQPEDLERHIRGPVFRRLLAVLELSRTRPDVLFVRGAQVRGIDWVQEVLQG